MAPTTDISFLAFYMGVPIPSQNENKFMFLNRISKIFFYGKNLEKRQIFSILQKNN